MKRIFAVILSVVLMASMCSIPVFGLYESFDGYTNPPMLGAGGWEAISGGLNSPNSAFVITGGENPGLKISGPAGTGDNHAFIQKEEVFAGKKLLKLRFQDDGTDGSKAFGIRSLSGAMLWYFMVKGGKIYTKVTDIGDPSATGILVGDCVRGQWYDVALVIDVQTSVYDLYLDGVKKQTVDYSGNIPAANMLGSLFIRFSLFPSSASGASFLIDDIRFETFGPELSDVKLTLDQLSVGSTVGVTYRFHSLDGASPGPAKVEWYAGSTPDGDFDYLAEGETYQIGASQSGKYIKAKVTPQDENGNFGKPQETNILHVSAPLAIITDPNSLTDVEQLSIAFNFEIDAATVEKEHFLIDSKAVADVQVQKNVITITPPSPFQTGKPYTLSISDKVRDKAGRQYFGGDFPFQIQKNPIAIAGYTLTDFLGKPKTAISGNTTVRLALQNDGGREKVSVSMEILRHGLKTGGALCQQTLEAGAKREVTGGFCLLAGDVVMVTVRSSAGMLIEQLQIGGQQ